MSKVQNGTSAFTPGERDYIRRELDRFFSTLPSVAEGFQLRTWRGGPEAGKPKLPPTARALIKRGLMRLDVGQRLPRLFFTETGLAELRAMMANGRLAHPGKFAHVRQELGIDPAPESSAPQEWGAGSGLSRFSVIAVLGEASPHPRLRLGVGPSLDAWTGGTPRGLSVGLATGAPDPRRNWRPMRLTGEGAYHQLTVSAGQAVKQA